MTQLPEWPPAALLEEGRINAIAADARDFALAHGLVYRPVPARADAAPAPDMVIHAPIAMTPTPFPRSLFEHAESLQPLFDKLYAGVALDANFLDAVIGGAVAKVDDFQAHLYNIWKQVRSEGIAQPVQLGLFRSDYLMHVEGDDKLSLALKQVEFNTISASFGPLCEKVSQLHQYLAVKGSLEAADPILSLDNMPENKALSMLTQGIADAHNFYSQSTRKGTSVPLHPVVLFVVQENERNAFDQRALEFELLTTHKIRVVRATLLQLSKTLSLHGEEHVLSIQPPESHTPLEVSTVYFRSAYDPSDYKTEADWETRLQIERSLAIKCPSVALQLAGAKKVQQVLAEPEVLERYLGQDADLVRGCFTQMYPLDDSSLGREALKLAHEEPQKYVLKPQREGGSHNIYKEDIPPALDAMQKRDAERDASGTPSAVREREGYILMSLIETPRKRGNIFLRAGGDAMQPLHVSDTVSELGMYGAVLFGPDAHGALSMHAERTGGYLLRTKSSESHEGGVAVGYSVIDTPLLV